MIEIKDKTQCCGCSACVQRCPKHCISMEEDEEGFLYPNVDKALCIDCGLCEKVCPVINQCPERKPLAVYAAKNPNEEIRMQSSSGGIFTMLAEKVIDEGGVVFGACWNKKWEVVHDWVEDKDGISKFRGSKYVQSNIGDNYLKAEQFLKAGRKVLFSGTPCQIAGLKHFLRKYYENLYTVDFICHGAPSPGVFRTFLRDEISIATQQGGGKNSVSLPCIPLVTEKDGLDCKDVEIKSINFRDKRNGWKKFGFALALSKATAAGEENSVLLSYTPLNKNLFLRGFLSDIYLRPSCYICPSKCLKSESDVTLGDFWGINTLLDNYDDDKGISVVLPASTKGKLLIDNCCPEIIQLKYNDLVRLNPALEKSATIPKYRARFFKHNSKSFKRKIVTITKKSPKIKLMAYNILHGTLRRLRKNL